MTTSVDHLDVVYCEGWDPVERAVVGPLRREEALARDTAGEQYAVLFFAGTDPQALIEVSWLHGTCVVWGFDRYLRRVVKREFHRIDESQILIVEEVEWDYTDPSQGEFSPTVTNRMSRTCTASPEGGMVVITGHEQRSMDAPLAALKRRVPPFGDWGPLLFESSADWTAQAVKASFTDDPFALLAQLSGEPEVWRLKPLLQHLRAARFVERYPPPHGVGVVPFTGPVWRPPQPLRPDPDVLALAGPAHPVSLRGQRLLIESHAAGWLRAPTGRLVACDPDDYFLAERLPYTVTIPPGTYQVLVNVARRTQAVGIDPHVAACGVLIHAGAVSSWELALVPGEDPRVLRDGATYGFGVDSGMGCFMDAAAIPAVTSVRAYGEIPFRERSVVGVCIADFEDPASGANVIAFSSGWGDGRYPVWIGRAADGSVACFVADMQLLAG